MYQYPTAHLALLRVFQYFQRVPMLKSLLKMSTSPREFCSQRRTIFFSAIFGKKATMGQFMCSTKSCTSNILLQNVIYYLTNGTRSTRTGTTSTAHELGQMSFYFQICRGLLVGWQRVNISLEIHLHANETCIWLLFVHDLRLRRFAHWYSSFLLLTARHWADTVSA